MNKPLTNNEKQQRHRAKLAGLGLTQGSLVYHKDDKQVLQFIAQKLWANQGIQYKMQKDYQLDDDQLEIVFDVVLHDLLPKMEFDVVPNNHLAKMEKECEVDLKPLEADTKIMPYC